VSASNNFISLNVTFCQTEYINQLLSVLGLCRPSTSWHLLVQI